MCQKNVEQKEITLYGKIPEILRESNDSQCKMALCHYSIFERKWQFCALGTIYHHYDERVWNILFGIKQKKILERSGIKKPPKVRCPICNARSDFISLIIHLNDGHRKSYNEIADLLERTKPYDESLPLLIKIKDSLKFVFHT